MKTIKFTKESIFILILTVSVISPVIAADTEYLNNSYFSNCPTINNVNNKEYDKKLQATDHNMKKAVLAMSKETEQVNKLSVGLIKEFASFFKYIDKKPLPKIKKGIYQKKDKLDKDNTKLHEKLTTIKGNLDAEQQNLGKAYCHVISHLTYFEGKQQETDHKGTLSSLKTNIEQLTDKQAKLDVVISDIDKFWGVLLTYIKGVEDSSYYLTEFMNSIIAYENNTCGGSKNSGKICTFPDADLSTLMSEQVILIDVNKSFLQAKVLLAKKAQTAWSNNIRATK